MMICELELETMVTKRGISFYRLALDAGISHPQMSKLRHGKLVAIPLTVIAALCAALDCGVEDILKLHPAKKGKVSAK